MPFQQPSWPSYLLSGFLALVCSWALAGCRFGNRYELPPDPDQVTGFYELKAQGLKFCVDTSATACKPAPTNQVPLELAATLSDPVALVLTQPDTGEAFFVNRSLSGSTLPIYVDQATQQLGVAAESAPETLWTDPACTTVLYLDQFGSYTRAISTAPSAAGVPISGRIQLKVEVTRLLSGDCAATLQQMHDCYHDASQCGEASESANADAQAAVQDFFGDFIQSGAMTSAEIPAVRRLAYSVDYY